MIVNNHESTLMLLRSTKELYPLSTFAFGVSQSSQQELGRYIGALILYRNGEVKEICAINKQGFYGDSFAEKLKNALFGAYAIDTCLKPIDIPFDEICILIADMLALDLQQSNPIFELTADPQILINHIRTAKSASQIFDLLAIPAPEDCLDVL